MIGLLGIGVQLFNGLGWVGKLVAIGSILAVLLGLYGTWHYTVYNRGYERAINDIAAQDKKAISAGQAARTRYRECVDSGMRWDQSTGECSGR